MTKLLPGFALCATATFLLAGCGGDSDSSTGIPIPPSSSTISYVGSPDVIAAWADPATLTFSGATPGTYAGKRQLARGTIDPMTGVDLQQPAGVELWKGSDGHVWAVDLAAPDTTVPTPVQVSSETGATVDATCTYSGIQAGANFDYQGVLFAPDLVTPTASSYVYRLPGVDGVCNSLDDVIHVVHPNMGPGDAPLVGAAMPTTAVYSSDGAVTGYIAKIGAQLVELDVNLANPVPVGTFAASIGVASPLPVGLETGYPTGRLFDVDGSIVYVDYAAGTTSASLFQIPNWTATDEHLVTAASPTTLYFAVNTPASGATPASSAIYAMPADGSAVPTVISLQPGLVRQMEFPVQGGNLVAGVEDAGAFTLVAIPEGQTDGSAGMTLATAAGFNGGRFTATADDVYYTMWTVTGSGGASTRSGTTAGIVGMDASVVQAPTAGSQFLFGGELDAWAAGDTTTQRSPFITVFEASGMTTQVTGTDPLTGATFTSDGLAGATLSSIDTGTNATIATLGTFPSGTQATQLQGSPRGLGHVFFIEAYNQATSQDPASRDLFLLNSQAAGSLTQATANLGQ